jgi:transposase
MPRSRNCSATPPPKQLLAKQGMATVVAATPLATAGDNPGRVRTEASFAALCGASPVDASSGKQLRHRLNRGGDRQANSALWTIAMTRLAHDPCTKAYAARRTTEGKTWKQIIRCLKRYIAREIYKTLCQPSRQPQQVKQDLAVTPAGYAPFAGLEAALLAERISGLCCSAPGPVGE